jgi:hypothetical protein
MHAAYKRTVAQEQVKLQQATHIQVQPGKWAVIVYGISQHQPGQ